MPKNCTIHPSHVFESDTRSDSQDIASDTLLDRVGCKSSRASIRRVKPLRHGGEEANPTVFESYHSGDGHMPNNDTTPKNDEPESAGFHKQDPPASTNEAHGALERARSNMLKEDAPINNAAEQKKEQIQSRKLQQPAQSGPGANWRDRVGPPPLAAIQSAGLGPPPPYYCQQQQRQRQRQQQQQQQYGGGSQLPNQLGLCDHSPPLCVVGTAVACAALLASVGVAMTSRSSGIAGSMLPLDLGNGRSLLGRMSRDSPAASGPPFMDWTDLGAIAGAASQVESGDISFLCGSATGDLIAALALAKEWTYTRVQWERYPGRRVQSHRATYPREYSNGRGSTGARGPRGGTRKPATGNSHLSQHRKNARRTDPDRRGGQHGITGSSRSEGDRNHARWHLHDHHDKGISGSVPQRSAVHHDVDYVMTGFSPDESIGAIGLGKEHGTGTARAFNALSFGRAGLLLDPEEVVEVFEARVRYACHLQAESNRTSTLGGLGLPRRVTVPGGAASAWRTARAGLRSLLLRLRRAIEAEKGMTPGQMTHQSNGVAGMSLLGRVGRALASAHGLAKDSMGWLGLAWLLEGSKDETEEAMGELHIALEGAHRAMDVADIAVLVGSVADPDGPGGTPPLEVGAESRAGERDVRGPSRSYASRSRPPSNLLLLDVIQDVLRAGLCVRMTNSSSSGSSSSSYRNATLHVSCCSPRIARLRLWALGVLQRLAGESTGPYLLGEHEHVLEMVVAVGVAMHVKRQGGSVDWPLGSASKSSLQNGNQMDPGKKSALNEPSSRDWLAMYRTWRILRRVWRDEEYYARIRRCEGFRYLMDTN